MEVLYLSLPNERWVFGIWFLMTDLQCFVNHVKQNIKWNCILIQVVSRCHSKSFLFKKLSIRNWEIILISSSMLELYLFPSLLVITSKSWNHLNYDKNSFTFMLEQVWWKESFVNSFVFIFMMQKQLKVFCYVSWTFEHSIWKK